MKKAASLPKPPFICLFLSLVQGVSVFNAPNMLS